MRTEVFCPRDARRRIPLLRSTTNYHLGHNGKQYGQSPQRRFLMVTTVLNWLLDAWGNVSAGSSGYSIPPGTLPFGS
ncbi:hypothetical protein [Nocardia sp. CNY236]|uniref:hypothetical protein n=1 Tax=Nocardia sp. CNY236 TaxID=1169152 RepID=UPI00040D20F8|nr:hypothetical protein [Nocardia sp. CNY236]